MAWRDNLLPASLDGVEFLYKQVSNTVGRRGIVHEFPKRDEPFAEDMGRKARRYQVQAFLIGENYASTREQLISVLEAGGDHDFVHPYRGSFTVKLIGDAKIIEKDDEGRFAQIDFTLVESGLDFPTVQQDTPETITVLVNDAAEKLGKTKFDLLGAIGAVLSSVANGLNQGSAALRKVNGKISGALNLVDNISGQLNAFDDAVNDLLSTPDRVMGELIGLALALMRLHETFVETIPVIGVQVEGPDFPAITLRALNELQEFESEGGSIPTPTPQSIQEEEAHQTITKVMHASALIGATEALAQQELESAQQAQEIVALLGEQYDASLKEDFEPEVMESLSALKSAMVEHFTSLAQQLPSIRTITLNYSEPALVTAYRLYGDTTQERDIINRNKVRHPCFMPAGVDLEVLSDA